VRSWGRARKWAGTRRPIRLGSIDEWWVLGCVIGVLLYQRITRGTCEQHHHNERRRLYKRRHIMSRVMGKGAGVAANRSGTGRPRAIFRPARLRLILSSYRRIPTSSEAWRGQGEGRRIMAREASMTERSCRFPLEAPATARPTPSPAPVQKPRCGNLNWR
jgi:hypothetical protein